MQARKKLFEERFSFKPTPSLYNKSRVTKPAQTNMSTPTTNSNLQEQKIKTQSFTENPLKQDEL